MDKKCLKRYRANRRELLSLEWTLERLYAQLEDVPDVSGKVSKSSDDFPYIEQHVTVQMQEPKKASEIKDRIRKKEKRHKALLADMAEAERIIMKIWALLQLTAIPFSSQCRTERSPACGIGFVICQ